MELNFVSYKCQFAKTDVVLINSLKKKQKLEKL